MALKNVVYTPNRPKFSNVNTRDRVNEVFLSSRTSFLSSVIFSEHKVSKLPSSRDSVLAGSASMIHTPTETSSTVCHRHAMSSYFINFASFTEVKPILKSPGSLLTALVEVIVTRGRRSGFCAGKYMHRPRRAKTCVSPRISKISRIS